MDVSRFVEFKKRAFNSISKVIVGKEEVIEKVIVSFIVSGHVLLEDVPGVGKTKLCRALSKTMDCSFSRIQFTPDLLPSDLTGIYFYDQKSQDFKYRKGPLVNQIILADEINRATPRTQSALLECMEEGQITVEGNTIELKPPFFVMATQNPIEQYGTFPLPEAQLDRFFMSISMGYPLYDEELKMMYRFMETDPIDELTPTITAEDIKYVQSNYRNIKVDEKIGRYILDLVNETRNNSKIELGCSPRTTLSLVKGGQAMAAISGRDYVVLEDIKSVAVPIMRHRIVLKNQIKESIKDKGNIIKEILSKVETPIGKE